jgi:UDP-N-acetylglucosamine--N-acetylmuramyl-(pentapeptide) pyrophosphoryl-undecaprenol N-acetylglucosamine transferase
MDLAYSVADFIVSRAGALAIAELAIAGLPTILIPLPTAAEDHQTANAKQLSDAGAAILIKDTDVDEFLYQSLENLMSDAEKSIELSSNIKQFAQPEAIHKIVRCVMTLRY